MSANLVDFSGNYFRSLFDNADQNCVLILEQSGTVIAINPAFTVCFGYKEKDILGKSGGILFTEEDRENGKFERELTEVISEGQSFDNNYLVHKNKSITWVAGESLLVKHEDGSVHILKIIQDIHKRKETEIALRNLNNFNESILGSIEDAVVVLDENMNIIKANNAFEILFKNTAQTAFLNFADIIQSGINDESLAESIQNVILTKRSFSNKQTELIITPGDKKVFDITCNPLKSSEENNVLLIIRDVTIYKELEKEREDVMGFVAHELRNPLSNVMLCNEIMTEALKENKPEQLYELLERSKHNVNRLTKMIAELYEAAKVNSGQLQLENSTFNFGEMVKEAITTFEVLQPDYHIVVKGSGDVEVYGDRYRLIQVLTNYLSNGIKYSDGKKMVILDIKHDQSTLTVSVKDEGLGISKEQLPYIFERFFRAEKTRSIEGIGLGLYLCRQIIHAHKGHVWVESEEGRGSTFYFSIPIRFGALQ